MKMRIGERRREGHLRAAHQARWGGCWDRSERKTPKKNCMPNAAILC